MENAKSLVRVHTHTHTHTYSLNASKIALFSVAKIKYSKLEANKLA